jgi:DNA-binding FadR family transcriptional regulator
MTARKTSERAAVRVARKIVGEIRQRRLQPGAQLAPEHRMLEKLGVARATLREALRFLELQGALRIKAGPGGGPIVSVPNSNHLASVLSLQLQFADASFRSVLEARMSVYPVLAAEAAHNASPDDIETLKQSVAKMRAKIDDADFVVEEFRRFQDVIAIASGNRVLGLLVNALHRMSEDSGVQYDLRERRQVVRSSQLMLGAIESGDAEEARAVTEKSLAVAMGNWERSYPDALKQPVSWLAVGRQ